jgi:hypothetical protein
MVGFMGPDCVLPKERNGERPRGEQILGRKKFDKIVPS